MKEKTNELQKLEVLESRLRLSDKLLDYKNRLLKGHKGEQEVIEMLRPYSSEMILLQDLYLSGTNTGHVQIDALLISRGMILLLEIKNYEGVHESKGDFLVNNRGLEFQNPKNQVLKAQLILQSILKEENFSSYSLKSLVIYPHNSFRLFNATPQDLHYSLENLESYISNHFYTDNGITSKDKEVATAIMSRVKNYPYVNELIPNYNLEELEKRMNCPNCRSIVEELTQKIFECQTCYQKNSKSIVLEYNIWEYELLFNKLPTYKQLHLWTSYKCSLKSCSIALTKFKKIYYS